MRQRKLYRLPQAIFFARRQRGILQKALAASAGIDGPRLSSLETGRALGPGKELVDRISQALNLGDSEHDALLWAAAHDRSMRALALEIPAEHLALFADRCWTR